MSVDTTDHKSPHPVEILTASKFKFCSACEKHPRRQPVTNATLCNLGSTTRCKNNPIWQDPKMLTVIPPSFPHHPDGIFIWHPNALNQLFSYETDTTLLRLYETLKFSTSSDSQGKSSASCNPRGLAADISQGTRRTVREAVLAGRLSTGRSCDGTHRHHSSTIPCVITAPWPRGAHSVQPSAKKPNCLGLLGDTTIFL